MNIFFILFEYMVDLVYFKLKINKSLYKNLRIKNTLNIICN